MSDCMSEIFHQEAGLVCSKTIEIIKLQKQVETLVSAITLIGGMAGNPDAIEACRNINKVARSTLKEVKG